jgi:pyruvate dehydrogenase E2 component (dihydrolipoamide acetyltransferase)
MAEVIAMPKLGFDMAEGTLVRWLIAEGETVEKGQVLAEIETDKATVEVESTVSGVLKRQVVAEGAVVPVGDPIAVIGAADESIGEEILAGKAEKSTEVEAAGIGPAAIEEPETPVSVATPGERIKSSPLARRMAAAAGLELAEIQGSGPGGRIVKADIDRALAAPARREAVPAGPAAPVIPLAPVWQPGAPIPADERTPIDRLRAIIGKRMSESKQQVPHFYLTSEIDAEPLLTARKQINTLMAEDQKVSINDFIIKAAALALRQFPNLNASLEGGEIIRYGHVNIGVAVALDAGLMTVVCKDADQKPLRLISQEVKEMAARARSGKVRPEDIEGSTFSISNLGMYDVEDFVAIINPPEAAILAVGSVKETPIAINGDIRIGLRMKLTLSADHRITDGAEAARFMQALKKILENPAWMLL